MNQQQPNRLLWLAAVTIALQAVVPAGYMPAPIANGLPFVLCPDGLPGAVRFLAAGGDARHGNHHEQQHDHAVRDEEPSPEWEFCPFGAVFGGPALIADYDAAFPLPQSDRSAADADRIVQSVPGQSWRARAPPTNEPIDV